jgi:NAD(P)-dependent dehydrogenase (short-subunit alcohol dehydrogenase family)
VTRFGRVDGLANVVGIYPAERVVEMSDEFWDNVILTNLTGVFYCCRAALARMLEAGVGNIVNVASIRAAVPRGASSRSAGSSRWKPLQRSASTWYLPARSSRHRRRNGSFPWVHPSLTQQQQWPTVFRWNEPGSLLRSLRASHSYSRLRLPSSPGRSSGSMAVYTWRSGSFINFHG